METVINLNEVVRASKKDNTWGLELLGFSPYVITLEMSNGRINKFNYEIYDYDLYCDTWRQIVSGIKNNLTINT